MKNKILIILITFSFSCHSQTNKIRKIKMVFHPAFHENSTLVIYPNNSKGKFTKTKEKKYKFHITKSEIIFEKIDSIYVEKQRQIKLKNEYIKRKTSLKNNDIVDVNLVEDVFEDGMIIIFELKNNSNENLKFEYNNNFNPFQTKLMVEIIEILKTQIPKEHHYFNDIINYL